MAPITRTIKTSNTNKPAIKAADKTRGTRAARPCSTGGEGEGKEVGAPDGVKMGLITGEGDGLGVSEEAGVGDGVRDGTAGVEETEGVGEGEVVGGWKGGVGSTGVAGCC